MTIREALAYIHAVDWRRSKPGLRRIHELLEKLGHPERTVRFVHITGTNGKGSTCAMLASILRAAGYRTGLYTSPYIFRFNERMQVDGQEIPDEELCAITEEVRPLADSMADHPSEFEMVTAIAFTWFARRKCDIVICEVGMGGEFDATNVILPPEAAVLCNIGLDHTAYLGDTVEKIAATKSGIIKSGCEAVLYPCAPSVAEIVSARCRSCGVTLHPVNMDVLTPLAHSLDGQSFDFGDLTDLHLPLLGRMQLYNAATALTVTEVLRRRGWHIDENAVRLGLAQVRWPVRFEVVRREPVHGGAGGEYRGLPVRSTADRPHRRNGGQGLCPYVHPAPALYGPVHHRDAGQPPRTAGAGAGGLSIAAWQAGNGLRLCGGRRGAGTGEYTL